jgi:hypothetical protein
MRRAGFAVKSSRDDLLRFRRGGWLSALAGAALWGTGLYGLGNQYSPLAAVWWMLGGILLGVLFGLGCFVVGCALLGLARRNHPPAEFTGMSAEQQRQLRTHERRRAKRGIAID